MNRQEEALKLSDELLADVELSRLGPQQCLLKASRVARLIGDSDAQEWMNFELNGYPNHGEDDSPQVVWMARMGRWTEPKKADDADGRKGYFVRLADLMAIADVERVKLANAQAPSLSGDFLVHALRQHQSFVSAATQTISTFDKIGSAVLAHIYEFASRTYYEMLFSTLQASLFERVQTDVDQRLAPTGGAALEKIASISDRLRDGDPEAVSGAMNTCRRLIDSVADAVFPPRDEPYDLAGQPVAVKRSNVLNRLSAHAHQVGAAKGRRDRLRRTLSDLYDRTSTGVHSEVTVDEATFLFLQTYVALGELLTLEAPDIPSQE